MFAVVIATHNRLDELKIAVKSVFDQVLLPRQLIIIDDASKVKIDESIFSNAPEGIECVLLNNSEPKGAAYSRNLGVTLSTEDYIAFLDDDDLFSINKLQKVKEYIEKDSADFYYHSYRAFYPNESIAYDVLSKNFEVYELSKILEANFIGGTSMVVLSREKFIELGMFDVSFPAIEDYELWVRFVKYGAKIVNIPDALTSYRIVSTKSSLSKSLVKDEIATRLFEIKYDKELGLLSKDSLRKYQIHKKQRQGYQAQVSGNRFKAFKIQIALLWISGSPLYAFKSVLCLLGLPFYLKVRNLF